MRRRTSTPLRPKLKVGFVVTASGAIAAKDALRCRVGGLGRHRRHLPAHRRGRAGPSGHARSPPISTSSSRRSRPGKPIVLREVGYPTAPECGSNDAAQAAFVSAVFGGWDRHADRVSVVTFRELVDLDARQRPRRSRSDTAARMQRSSAFWGRWASAAAARPKPGLGALIREARARGF